MFSEERRVKKEEFLCFASLFSLTISLSIEFFTLHSSFFTLNALL